MSGSNNNGVEFEIRAKAILGDASKQINEFLKEIEDHSDAAAKKTSGVFDSLTGFYKNNQESFAAIGTVLAATVAGLSAVAAGVVALGVHGSDVADVRAEFNRMSQAAGTAGEVILTKLVAATDGVVSKFDLMSSATKAMSMGLKLQADDWSLVGESARVFADRTGTSVKDAYDTVLQAMSTGRDMTLKTIGMNIDATKAVKDYADAIGVEAADLNESQVIHAKQTAMLAVMRTELAATGGVTLDFADRIALVKSGIANFTDSLGEAISNSPVLASAMDGIGAAITAAFGNDQQALVQTLIGWIEKGAFFVLDMAQAGLRAADVIGRAWSGLNLIFNGSMSIVMLLAQGIGKVAEGAAYLAERIPGVGAAFKGTSAFLQGFNADLGTLQRGFHAQAEEALAGVQGNSAFHRSLYEIENQLDATRNGMINAGSATSALTGHTQAAGTAAHVASGGFDALGRSTGATDKAFREFNKSLTTLTTDVARGLKNLSDTDFNKEFGSKLEDARREMEKFGITGTQVPEAIRQGLERLNQIKIADFIKEGNATAMAEMNRIADDMAKKAQDANKRSMEAMRANLDAMATASANAEEEHARQTMSAADFEIYQIQRAADEKKAKLDQYGAFYDEAMTAIDQETAEKMAAAKTAHNAEVAQMQAAMDTYSHRVTGILGSIPGLIQSSFTGGGGISGFVNAITSKLGSELGGKAITDGLTGLFNHFSTHITGMLGSTLSTALGMAIPGIGPAIGSMIMPIAKKIGGWIKSAFGGPSEQELEGRQILDNITDGMRQALTGGQMAEVQAAVADGWKESLAVSQIAIRDAFVASGKSAEDAEVYIKRFWDATKEGGDAVTRVIQDVTRITGRDLTKAVSTVTDQFDEMNVSVQGLGDQFKIVRDAMGQPIVVPISYDVQGGPNAPNPASLPPAAAGNTDQLFRSKNVLAAFEDDFPDWAERIQNWLASGGAGNESQAPAALGLPDFWEWFNRKGFQGAASGGVYSKPAMRVIAERSPEIVGDSNTIVSALSQAMQRVGFGDKARGADGGVHFHLTTPLATVDTIRQMVYSEIGPTLLDWLDGNKSGSRTRLKRIMETA